MAIPERSLKKNSELRSLLISLLFLTICSCINTSPEQEKPTPPNPVQEATLRPGQGITIYNTVINLGDTAIVLERLFPPPERLSDDQLLFEYGHQVRALFADENNNGLLEKYEPIIALSMNDKVKISTAEGLGFGSEISDISAHWGKGEAFSPIARTFIWPHKKDLLAYFKKGIALSYNQENKVTAATIFWPTDYPHSFNLIADGYTDLDNTKTILDNFPTRSMAFIIFGAADENYTLADSNLFIDNYLLTGLQIIGPNSLIDSQISHLLTKYPFKINDAPPWDSTTDDLFNLFGSPVNTPEPVTNNSNFQYYYYKYGTNWLSFGYKEKKLEQVIIGKSIWP